MTHRCGPRKISHSRSLPRDVVLGVPRTPDTGQGMRAEFPIARTGVMRITSSAVGMSFLGDLARKRSLASAALLFLILIDEIEGMFYVVFGVFLAKPELFLRMEEVLFPASIVAAGVVTLLRFWRRKAPARRAEPVVEMLDPSTIAQRIGAVAA